MEKAWKKHGENSMDSIENHGAWSWSKIPWFSWENFHAFHATLVLKTWEIHGKTMEKAWGKFHGFP